MMGQWLGLCTVTAGGPGVILGQGNEIPQAVWHGQKQANKNVVENYLFLKNPLVC